MDGEKEEADTGTNEEVSQQILTVVPKDLIQLENGDSLANIEQPPMSNNQSIGSIGITNSKDIHIGTDLKADNITIKKIDAKNITIFQNWALPDKQTLSFLNNANKKPDQRTKEESCINKNRNSNNRKLKWKKLNKSVKAQIIICSIYGVIVILMVVLLLVWALGKKSNNNNNNTTISPPIITTTLTPPTDWFVNVSDWSHNVGPNDTSYEISEKPFLAVDDIEISNCNTKYDCYKVLRKLQTQISQKNNTNYNYMIGGDGRVYEGRGNNYPPDVKQDYSSSYIKVAFIGQYIGNNTLNQLQKHIFSMLIDTLTSNRQLKENYQIVPQYCRNIPNEHGPAPNIINFLNHTFINHMQNCKPNTGWWPFFLTTIINK